MASGELSKRSVGPSRGAATIADFERPPGWLVRPVRTLIITHGRDTNLTSWVTYSPEFAMLEAYQAYSTYDTVAALAHDLVIECVRAVFGSDTVRHADGSEHDLRGEWRYVTLHAAVSVVVDRGVTVDTPVGDLCKLAAEFDVKIED